ncbi:Coiled-coil domain-containing protein 86 [Collichthys lucidus]|uniref:Coiled-coil domain-containing protein 86 n=1 Tax=Collichthys lucidus TaxID=240159 RepID=A0A4V6ANM3_COLLU|nr:Coiled-coil domain-containing protein 86 [Collichthys lucidus]
MPEEKPAPEATPAEEEVQEPPPETRRTRSGRKVRTPAALLDSEAPVRTPTRRTRRSVLQEKNTEVAERVPESVPEEKLGMSAEPEPAAEADSHPSEPAPAETGITSTETIPKKKPRLGRVNRRSRSSRWGNPNLGECGRTATSRVVRDKSLCSSWEKKMAAKRDKDLVKQYASQLKEEKAKQKEDKRKRREENLKRRAENERKSEIVQVIRNTTKIKRMKKKQLRKIEKRDTWLCCRSRRSHRRRM